MCYRAILDRLDQDELQTIGHMTIFQGLHRVFQCYTLELPWRFNEPFKSCIPAGDYRVESRNSDKYGNHYLITGVPARDLILIHFGNFHRDTQGCILVGSDIIDIDGDGHKDVTHSKNTMRALNGCIQSTSFNLRINDNQLKG